jgi:predicted tellurium resistance membrane protein TerC
MALLEKMPILVWAGAALLGWIAGDVIATDPAVHPRLDALFAGPLGAGLDGVLNALGMAPHFANHGNGGELALAGLGVIVVLVAGTIWRKRTLQKHAEESAKAA